MSPRVTNGDDLMDCDYEVEEKEMGSKKKALPRRLAESQRTPSPSRCEDDNYDDEEEGSTDEGLEYNPRLVVSPIDVSSLPARRKKWDEDHFQSNHC